LNLPWMSKCSLFSGACRAKGQNHFNLMVNYRISMPRDFINSGWSARARRRRWKRRWHTQVRQNPRAQPLSTSQKILKRTNVVANFIRKFTDPNVGMSRNQHSFCMIVWCASAKHHQTGTINDAIIDVSNRASKNFQIIYHLFCRSSPWCGSQQMLSG
jgi:hypothetical protein